MHIHIKKKHFCSADFFILFILQNEVAILLKPISEKIQEIQTFRERNRGSNMFNHLSAVSESIPALGWVTIVSPEFQKWTFFETKPVFSPLSTMQPWVGLTLVQSSLLADGTIISPPHF